LVISGVIYTLTDPPLKFVRRFIKPVRIGQIALDFGWTVVMLVAIVAMYIAEYITIL
jgi:YggT family protein